ncbi:MAG: hypothetical protein K8S54_13250, partial [Spirochaetia bacterium]|nr:hypothetical protein [Spirochaetia bacterium]
GMIKNGDALTSIDDFLALRQAGQITVIVDRGGKDISLGLNNNSPGDQLRVRSTGDRRVFFYGAGLIFQELDYEIIHDHKSGTDSQLRYRYESRFEDRLNRETDLDVVLTNVFPDYVNLGAETFLSGPLESINGQPVRSLVDLRNAWKNAANQYFVLKFRNRPGLLVIPRDDLTVAEKRIREKYNLSESSLAEGTP